MQSMYMSYVKSNKNMVPLPTSQLSTCTVSGYSRYDFASVSGVANRLCHGCHTLHRGRSSKAMLKRDLPGTWCKESLQTSAVSAWSRADSETGRANSEIRIRKLRFGNWKSRIGNWSGMRNPGCDWTGSRSETAKHNFFIRNALPKRANLRQMHYKLEVANPGMQQTSCLASVGRTSY